MITDIFFTNTINFQVRIRYRAFCHDNIVLVLHRRHIPSDKLSYSGANIGFQAVEALIDWQPRENSSGELLWMSLCEAPKIPIKPAALVVGSRALLDKVSKSVEAHFSSAPKVLEDWKQWNSSIPASDDIADYLKFSALHVPFEAIFNISGQASICSSSETVKSRKRLRPEETLHKVLSTASVQTSKHSRQAPYVWADSGATVFVGVEADVDLECDPLAEKDYTTMTNNELKNLLVTLKDKYGVVTKVNALNKKSYVELVSKAVANARTLLSRQD
jgi:hypothetical protein